jgi:hypothetical protein
MGALSGAATATQAAQLASALPGLFGAVAPATGGGLFGLAPAASMPVPNFLRGLVGASDALVGDAMFDVVGEAPAAHRELLRAARDPRVAEAFEAARALHSWMHEHPLRGR